jgi:hypothetical protein
VILISAALVLVAIVLLIAGVVLAKPFLVMWSIVVSVLSAVCLLIGALLRRHELFPKAGGTATGTAPVPPVAPAHTGPTGPTGPQGATVASAMPPAPPGMAPGMTPPGMPHPAMLGAPPMPQTAPPPRPRNPYATGPGRTPGGGILAPDAIVVVIPGRRRFHRPGCRQLAGRDREELTYEEAREEGFTPCTTCLPEGAARPAPEPPPPSEPPRVAGPAASRPPPVLGPPIPIASLEPGQSKVDWFSSSQPTDGTSSPSASAEPPPDTGDRAPAHPDPAKTVPGKVITDDPTPARTEAEGEESETTGVVRIPAASETPKAEPAPEKPSDARDAESRPSDVSPADVKSSEVRSSGEGSSDSKPSDVGRSEGTVRPDASGQARSGEVRSDDVVGSGERRPDGNASEGKPAATNGAGGSAPAKEADAEAPAKDRDATLASLRPGMVKVILGTRRYHSPDCPLISGIDDGGIEIMSKSEARAAGLTNCSVCQNDRQSVS